ncbi:SMI1/KNR4 family protein [Paraliomyxa miuraensis]|uniref:SMI1/KNR4 family protein n=1 Tax=Paraliomyxa miuraensis TaxID=376150 RepID=UPI0022582EA6|nr:SMI1/KNR4 family protein [Paraliomyxa miuraensis]MCX4239127.1 SMI1/KNR4 family protein [Paraliomyxa miuraensis]
MSRLKASQYLEWRDGKSTRFFEAKARGSVVTIRTGALGSEGRTRTVDCASPDEAKRLVKLRAIEKYVDGWKYATPPPKGVPSPSVRAKKPAPKKPKKGPNPAVVWKRFLKRLEARGLQGCVRRVPKTAMPTKVPKWAHQVQLRGLPFPEDYREFVREHGYPRVAVPRTDHGAFAFLPPRWIRACSSQLGEPGSSFPAVSSRRQRGDWEYVSTMFCATDLADLHGACFRRGEDGGIWVYEVDGGIMDPSDPSSFGDWLDRQTHRALEALADVDADAADFWSPL